MEKQERMRENVENESNNKIKKVFKRPSCLNANGTL